MTTRVPGDGWHRLHPLSPLVRSVRGVVGLVVALGATALLGGSGSTAGRRPSGGHTRLVTDLVILVLGIAVGVISWLVTRWRIEGRTLLVESGLLRRQSKQVPLERLQTVDILRPGLARVLGLSEVRVRVAGGAGSDARLAYLSSSEAEVVRARLLAISQRANKGSAPPAEHLVLAVPPGRVVVSVLLEAATLGTLAFVVALVLVSALVPGASVTAAGVIPFVIVLVIGLWRRVNDSWGFQLAQAPDGLRLRAGLVQRAAETIPTGRIQAVRKVQPLLWRPMGWCRIEVEVGGRQRRRRENADVGRQRRVLLPVGNSASAEHLLSLVATHIPVTGARPPARALWKAPLSYHFLTAAWNGSWAMATNGRVRLTTTWVPLAKVQSLRLVQGPLQRRLGLATLWVDAAGRRDSTALRDRVTPEAARLIAELTDSCREARREPNPPPAPRPDSTPPSADAEPGTVEPTGANG